VIVIEGSATGQSNSGQNVKIVSVEAFQSIVYARASRGLEGFETRPPGSTRAIRNTRHENDVGPPCTKLVSNLAGHSDLPEAILSEEIGEAGGQDEMGAFGPWFFLAFVRCWARCGARGYICCSPEMMAIH
jgi:hypothetical protein